VGDPAYSYWAAFAPLQFLAPCTAGARSFVVMKSFSVREDRLATLVAALIPALYALASGAPFGHVGRAPAFSAAVLTAPVTPAELFARLCSFIPLGPLSLRLGFASALALGLLGAALQRNVDLLLRAQGVEHGRLRALLGVSFSWLALGALPVLGHGLIPGAHALGAALSVIVLGTWGRGILEPNVVGRGRMAWGGVCFGLLVAVDPVAGGALVPAAMGWRWLACRRAGLRTWLGGVVLGASPLWGRWLVVAREPLPHWPDALGLAWSFEPAAQLLAGHALFGIAALLGAIALWQSPQLRGAATLWVLAAAGPVLAACLLPGLGLAHAGEVDLAPALAALTLLAAALSGALLAPDEQPRRHASRARLWYAGGCCAIALFGLQLNATRADQSGFVLAETLATLDAETLPPRALVLHADPVRLALARVEDASDRTRPDVWRLSLASLGDPDAARALADTPLRSLVRSYLLHGRLLAAELESLSVAHPIWLDTDPSPRFELATSLRPAPLGFEVLGSRVGRADQREAAGAQEQALADLGTAAVRSAPLAEADPRELIARLQLSAARHFSARADNVHAATAIQRGRAARPTWAAWDTLAMALPLDVAPTSPTAFEATTLGRRDTHQR
jgi:hypothetical protein